MLSLALAFDSIAAIPLVGFDFYVDSTIAVSGDGKSPATAFKTLAELPTITAGNRIGLAAGSQWREQLEILSTINVSIGAYSSGAAPIIRADDSLSSGGWTKEATATNVYKRTFTNLTDANSYQNCWENDLPMTETASIAACDAAAGSRFVDTATPGSGTGTLYINATGADKNPATNGKTYDFALRLYCIHLDSDGCSVSGVKTLRNAHHDGSIVLSGKGVTVSGCEARDGNKHNVLIGSGAVRNTTAWNAYFGSGTSNLIVGFLSDPTGETLTVSGCTTGLDGYNSLVSGFYCHATANKYSGVTISSSSASTMGGGFGGDNIAANGLTITNPTLTECLAQLTFDVGATVTNVQATSSVSGNRLAVISTTDKVTFSGGKVCCTDFTGEMIQVTSTGWNVEIDGVTFGAHAASSFSILEGDNAGALKLRNNVFDGTNFPYGFIIGRNANATIDSDFNQWTAALKMEINNTTYNDFAAYQSGTGQDAHSTTGAASGC